MYVRKRIDHWCPVEKGKSQPEGPPVPVGNEARRVCNWNGGPEGWDFPCEVMDFSLIYSDTHTIKVTDDLYIRLYGYRTLS